MEVELTDIGKKFNREWIFQNINLHLTSNNGYAILGGNGSGKSTLLQLISGFLSPSKGEIQFSENNNKIDIENIFRHISIATPYLELYEDLTLKEHLIFQQKFKPFRDQLSIEACIELIELPNVKTKSIKNFSSGMKQRVRLGLAILADSSILLLDEPSSNLDKKGREWYEKLIVSQKENRITVIASNHVKEEYRFCQETIEVEQFKLSK